MARHRRTTTPGTKRTRTAPDAGRPRGERRRPRRRFGQHFLQPAWADRIVSAIAPSRSDVVLEIGPGAGILTVALAPAVRRIVAVEVDRDLAARLTESAPRNVEVVAGDVLVQDLAGLLRSAARDGEAASEPPGRLRVVGNLPYNISSPILQRLIGLHAELPGLLDAVVLLQEEVVARLTAHPGSKEYGAMTLRVRMHARVDRLLGLPPGAFRPAPKVHSALARLTFLDRPAAPVRSAAHLDTLIGTIFSYRRKTLANALKHLPGPPSVASGVIREAGSTIDLTRRPETLDLPEVAHLADLFASADRSAVL